MCAALPPTLSVRISSKLVADPNRVGATFLIYMFKESKLCARNRLMTATPSA